MADKVTATPEALQLLAEIVADHGPVLFHQSGGCCDGSSPMCYPRGEFLIGDRDVKLGEIGGAPFYIGGPQYEFWKHTDLIIDVVPGRGGMFSLDNGRERRFLTRSEICALPGAAGDERESSELRAGAVIGEIEAAAERLQQSPLHQFGPAAQKRFARQRVRTSQAMARPVQRRGHQEYPPNHLGWRRALEAWGDQITPPAPARPDRAGEILVGQEAHLRLCSGIPSPRSAHRGHMPNTR